MEALVTSRPGKIKMNVDQSQRLHGIDALRAIAMILGMLLHATIAYKEHPLPTWPHDNGFHHWSFDFAYHVIHSFRMPLFFLIAGYFSRLLFHKLGEKAFVTHRFKRIAVPFLFSFIFILPFTIFPFSIYRYTNMYPGQWNLIFRYSLKSLFHWNGMAHLWFLYYLIIYYAGTIAFFRIKKKIFHGVLPAKVSSAVNFFHPGSGAGIILFAIITWSTLLLSNHLYLNVDTGIFPAPAYLLFYGTFFFMGWLINKRPITFAWISKLFWPLISAGAGLCILLFLVDFYNYAGNGWQTACIKLAVAFQVILLVYGIMGFFLRYCNVENKLWKYISDASYWMYLVHLGIIAGLQIWFMHTSIPGITRFLLVLFIPLGITLVTYHYFVRYTILGDYLHGKRHK